MHPFWKISHRPPWRGCDVSVPRSRSTTRCNDTAMRFGEVHGIGVCWFFLFISSVNVDIIKQSRYVTIEVVVGIICIFDFALQPKCAYCHDVSPSAPILAIKCKNSTMSSHLRQYANPSVRKTHTQNLLLSDLEVGVDIISGYARFGGPNEVILEDGRSLKFRKCILGTGVTYSQQYWDWIVSIVSRFFDGQVSTPVETIDSFDVFQRVEWAAVVSRI